MKRQMLNEQEIRRRIDVIYKILDVRPGWHLKSAMPTVSMLAGCSQRNVKEALSTLKESGRLFLVGGRLYTEQRLPDNLEFCPLCHQSGKLYPNVEYSSKGKKYSYVRFRHYKDGKDVWHALGKNGNEIQYWGDLEPEANEKK